MWSCQELCDLVKTILTLPTALLAYEERYGLIKSLVALHVSTAFCLIKSSKVFSRTLLQQGISEPIFYGDLVYKFKQIVGKPKF